MTHKDMFKGIGYKSLDKQHGDRDWETIKFASAECNIF